MKMSAFPSSDHRDTDTSGDTVNIAFTLNAKINLNGESPTYLREQMEQSFRDVVTNGALTGTGAAEVMDYEFKTTLLTPREAEITEEEIRQWISSQVADGQINLEDICSMVARFALEDPSVSRKDFVERIELVACSDEDDDEALPGQQPC